MENINLCECLKDMPKGTKLYSTIYGKVSLLRITDINEDYPIGIEYYNGYNSFTIDGKCLKYGEECVLFPSKEMRDWTKFFKHGDAVVCRNGALAIFDSWKDTTYTVFFAKYLKANAYIYENKQCNTQDFAKASEKQRNNFIKEIESQFKSKLNLETLEIEHCALKPFDKVLVRDYDSREWQIEVFSLYKPNNTYPYVCLADTWKQCIPYNEETAYLLGTKIDYEKDYSKRP